ncbi:MAG: FAD binding domain-containing protein [Propionibacteriaceae bacterium]
MDQDTITEIRPARTRADLAVLSPTSRPIAGGSWVFSEPNVDLERYVDLTAFGWAPWAATDAGLELAATCTLAELAALPAHPGWTAHPLLFQCCTALHGSFKIWTVATVGGNIATSLPAGPMTSLAAGLDATALVWRADGTDQTLPVAELVTGNQENALALGDVLRSLLIPTTSLGARTAFRKIALSPLGRSGSVVIGRVDPDGAYVLTVSAATLRPIQLRWPRLPEPGVQAAAVAAIDAWFTDPHGAADWRRAVSVIMAEEIRAELLAPDGCP